MSLVAQSTLTCIAAHPRTLLHTLRSVGPPSDPSTSPKEHQEDQGKEESIRRTLHTLKSMRSRGCTCLYTEATQAGVENTHRPEWH